MLELRSPQGCGPQRRSTCGKQKDGAQDWGLLQLLKCLYVLKEHAAGS